MIYGTLWCSCSQIWLFIHLWKRKLSITCIWTPIHCVQICNELWHILFNSVSLMQSTQPFTWSVPHQSFIMFEPLCFKQLCNCRWRYFQNKSLNDTKQCLISGSATTGSSSRPHQTSTDVFRMSGSMTVQEPPTRHSGNSQTEPISPWDWWRGKRLDMSREMMLVQFKRRHVWIQRGEEFKDAHSHISPIISTTGAHDQPVSCPPP